MLAWMSKKIIELRLILIGCSILLLVGSVTGIKYVSFSPDMENFFPENHLVPLKNAIKKIRLICIFGDFGCFCCKMANFWKSENFNHKLRSQF